MIAEGSTLVDVEEYVAVRAARIDNTGNDVASGGDPTPPEGIQAGTYQLYWRYDPDGRSGLTGQSWYGERNDSLPNFLSMSEEEYNTKLYEMYTNQGIEAVQAKIDFDFVSWKDSGRRTEFINNNRTLVMELWMVDCLRMY